jgi:hypothetical protein
MGFTQEFTFETASLDDLQRMMHTICSIIFTRPDTVEISQPTHHSQPPYRIGGAWPYYPSHAAAFFLERYPELNSRLIHGDAPLHGFICQLQAANDKNYDSSGALVEAAIHIVKATPITPFEDMTGEGPFGAGEGTVEIGYRLHWSTAVGARLAVSHCHIYYSK